MSILSTTYRASAGTEIPSPRRANPFVGPVPFAAADADYALEATVRKVAQLVAEDYR